VKRICMGLAAALSFAVFGTATALAQSAPGAGFGDFEYNGSVDVSIVLAGNVQEEVEILRRLLDNDFATVYGHTPPHKAAGLWIDLGMSAPMMGGGMPPGGYSLAERPAPDLQGVYLKDYGVVYTVTQSSPPNQMSPGPSVGKVTRTPLSPWERTRKELRGEKIEDEGKGAMGSPSLSDVILKVLADNGKHFTRLAEGERITVAVTFRGAVGEYGVPIQYSAGELRAPPTAPGSPGGSTPGVGGAPPTPTWETDVRNAIRLGDLHLQRGKSQDAIAAYKEALNKLANELASGRIAQGRTLGFASPDEVSLLLMRVDLYNKLAQACVKAGESEAAREALKKASELAKMASMAETLTGGAATANLRLSTPALPSKLIVTASKKLLDEVGAGKMTFEAFRKAATVEYVTPPAADKK
jgi:tetratricopeptide (TPR) repeat protein